ncbi:V0 complex, c/d subunit of ATPase, partial [Mycena olivaceomarginata]
FRTQLSATDYGNFLANEPLPISTATIADKATQILVDQFNYIRSNARDKHELLERCHPLGVFDTMPALCELYQSVLPLAPYFRECLSASDLDDLNIEIIRNTVYKAYLEDFYHYCSTLSAPTSDVMHKILDFEADRRTVNITINSFNTELTKDQRAKLFPAIGRLSPEGNNQLAKADEIEQVRLNVSEYRSFFTDSSANGTAGEKGDLGAASQLEDRFFTTEVHLNKQVFLQQFQYGVFYSYMKLKEQEIRNSTWIAECIAQDARDRMNDYIPIF